MRLSKDTAYRRGKYEPGFGGNVMKQFKRTFRAFSFVLVALTLVGFGAFATTEKQDAIGSFKKMLDKALPRR